MNDFNSLLYIKCWALWVLLWLLSGCITFSPDEWSPAEQRRMQKACRLACYPATVRSYESVNGKCSCQSQSTPQEEK